MLLLLLLLLMLLLRFGALRMKGYGVIAEYVSRLTRDGGVVGGMRGAGMFRRISRQRTPVNEGGRGGILIGVVHGVSVMQGVVLGVAHRQNRLHAAWQ